METEIGKCLLWGGNEPGVGIFCVKLGIITKTGLELLVEMLLTE